MAKTESKVVAKDDQVTTTEPQKKPGSNKKIMILVIVVLLLCCFVTIFAVIVIYQGLKNSNNGITGGIVTNTVAPTGTPDLSSTNSALAAVKDKYLATTSYHFTGDAAFEDGSSVKVAGEFKGPNSEHITTTASDGLKTEEIYTNDIYYIKEGTGAWETTADPYHAAVQRKEMAYFFDSVAASAKASVSADSLALYSYTDTENAESWQLSVHQQSGLPVKLHVEYLDENGKQVKENLNFTEYNDAAINIVAPAVAK